MADLADSVLEFYEQMAEEYHEIFADWDRSIAQHGEVLDRVIRSYLEGWPLSLLDCSCGIGTQAIGLALKGYQVHATDISPRAVERCKREAEKRGASVKTGVADIRTLPAQVKGRFDVVISCDNAVPHLVMDGDLRLAAGGIWQLLKQDGLALISIRDYDEAIIRRPRADIPRLLEGSDGRRIVFQIWDWEEGGHTYVLHQFILREVEEGGWQTWHFSTLYRALLRLELSDILASAGFSDIRWLMPQETGYHQPIVVAGRK